MSLLCRVFAGCLCSIVFSNATAHAQAAHPPLSLSSGELSLDIDDRGIITYISGAKRRENYLLLDKASPLFRIKLIASKEYLLPVKVLWEKQDKGMLLECVFEGQRKARIRILSEKRYLTCELLEIDRKEEVELVSWGPIQSTFSGAIGGAAGVTSNGEYVLGIQGLNIKTVGGFEVKQRDRIVNAAHPIEGGSQLQAFTRNRTFMRKNDSWIHQGLRVYPIPGHDVVGSKIALFGSTKKHTLDVIAAIETEQGLPHPEDNGQWLKKSQRASSSKFIMSFTPANIDTCIEVAKKAGIECVYHPHLFETWGHFHLNKRLYPNGAQSVKECAERARQAGINLGAHTLTNFITSNDPYVSPTPDPRLAVHGVTRLAEDISATDREITLPDDVDIHTYRLGEPSRWSPLYVIRVGNELIEYSSVSNDRPWVLQKCKRGAFGTLASAHKKDSEVAKLASHAYKVFFPDIRMLPEVAERLADFFNETGLERISFDGFEGCLAAGHGRFGGDLFVKHFYDRINNKAIINNSSDLSHYYWHICTNESWGEPWTGSFRESQLEHRLRSRKRFADNFLPAKLGQFSIKDSTTVKDINWVMGLCAGLDAGVDFYVSPNVTRTNPQGEAVLKTIQEWETARNTHSFTDADKIKLRDPQSEYSLHRINGHWKVQFTEKWGRSKTEKQEISECTLSDVAFNDKRVVSDARISNDFKHISRSREPGEPTSAVWEYDNPLEPQRLQFAIRLSSVAGGKAVKPWIKVGAEHLAIPFDLQPGQSVFSLGTGEIELRDNENRVLDRKKIRDISIASGRNVIQFDYSRESELSGPEVTVNIRIGRGLSD